MLIWSHHVDIPCIETKLNTTYIDHAVFVFRAPILILSVSVYFFLAFSIHLNEFVFGNLVIFIF